MGLTERTQRDLSPSEERRLDGALQSFFLARGSLVLLALMAALLPFCARNWLWSPLAELGESWLIVAGAWFVCALSLVAATQLAFEPRWRIALIAMLSVALLALVAVPRESYAPPQAFQDALILCVFFGLSSACSRRGPWTLWRRRPQYALMRVVLSDGELSDSTESEEDAMRVARKRMWRSSLLGIGACGALTLVTAWLTYEPGLRQEIERFRAAWNAGDRESLEAFAVYPESFGHELDALQAETGENRLPSLEGFLERDRSSIRRLVLPDQTSLPVWKLEARIVGQWRSLDWIPREGRWRLLAMGDSREDGRTAF